MILITIFLKAIFSLSDQIGNQTARYMNLKTVNLFHGNFTDSRYYETTKTRLTYELCVRQRQETQTKVQLGTISGNLPFFHPIPIPS